MKKFLQNTLLVIASIVLGLVLIEAGLRVKGDFASLASQKLVHSPTIWDRPVSTTEFHKHPDLGRQVEIHFDSEGVRNHSRISTNLKRNIIGFFGDSFTENRRIEDRFSFTTILDEVAAPAARVVNYGVDGYGLDQSYLRYRKYRAHDLRHVVYVFCDNDLRNLYETGLTDLSPDGDLIVRAAAIRPLYQVIGRLHLTYLVLTAYYRVVAMVRAVNSNDGIAAIDWFEDGKAQGARYQDRYADAVVLEFLSSNPSQDTLRLARKFLLLTQKWRREVEAEGRTFTVLVLPRAIDTSVAAKLFRDFDGRVIYTNDYFGKFESFAFRNDYHWNEYGNLKVAEFVLGNSRMPFRSELQSKLRDSLKDELDAYYKKPQ